MLLKNLTTTTDPIKSKAMKKTIFILLLIPFWAIGQTPTENYVKTTTYNGEQATLPKSK